MKDWSAVSCKKWNKWKQRSIQEDHLRWTNIRIEEDENETWEDTENTLSSF